MTADPLSHQKTALWNKTAMEGEAHQFIRKTVTSFTTGQDIPVVCVSRLDALRWLLRFPRQKAGPRKEIYISLDEGSLVYTTTHANRTDIVVNGNLSDGCVANLGDCLIKALYEEIHSIAICLHKTAEATPASCAMFQCFGRSISHNKTHLKITIHGDNPATVSLNQALSKGLHFIRRNRMSS